MGHILHSLCILSVLFEFQVEQLARETYMYYLSEVICEYNTSAPSDLHTLLRLSSNNFPLRPLASHKHNKPIKRARPEGHQNIKRITQTSVDNDKLHIFTLRSMSHHRSTSSCMLTVHISRYMVSLIMF